MSPTARFMTVAFAALATLASAGCGWPYTSAGSGGGSGSTAGTGGTTSASGDPPILDAINMTEAVQASGGFYTVYGSITFHTDDTYVVTSANVETPVTAKTITVAIPSLSSAAGYPFQFQLPDQVPFASAGATTYIVTLVTNGGAQSTPVDESVVLQ